jgi:hypothetical protein
VPASPGGLSSFYNLGVEPCECRRNKPPFPHFAVSGRYVKPRMTGDRPVFGHRSLSSLSPGTKSGSNRILALSLHHRRRTPQHGCMVETRVTRELPASELRGVARVLDSKGEPKEQPTLRVEVNLDLARTGEMQRII